MSELPSLWVLCARVLMWCGVGRWVSSCCGCKGSPEMTCILVCCEGEERCLAMILAAVSAPSFPMMELCACTLRIVKCVFGGADLMVLRMCVRRCFMGWCLMDMGFRSMFCIW